MAIRGRTVAATSSSATICILFLLLMFGRVTPAEHGQSSTASEGQDNIGHERETTGEPDVPLFILTNAETKSFDTEIIRQDEKKMSNNFEEIAIKDEKTEKNGRETEIPDRGPTDPSALHFVSQIPLQSADDHPHQKRNYASKECGAKVLYSNDEAENRGAILNDPERDDYMRNPCERAQNKFLIIELCETIQPSSLEIANFELFSSNPKDFRLWGSERYPTQEWLPIGEFEAQDNRQIQHFSVTDRTSYSKFIKLELLSHYGKEHFCTLSTFRLYGTSMVDEYEAEAASSSLPIIEPVPVIPIQQMELPTFSTQKMTVPEKDPLYEDYENNTNGEVAAECSLEHSNENTDERKNETNINGQSGDGNVSKTNSAEATIIEDDANEESPAKTTTNFILVESQKDERPVETIRSRPSTENVLKNIVVDVMQFGSNLKEVLGQAFLKAKLENRNGTAEQRPRQNSTMSARLWRRSLFRNPAKLCSLCPSDPSLQRQCTLLCWTFFLRKGLQPQPANNNRRTRRGPFYSPQLSFINRISAGKNALCPLSLVPLTCPRNGAREKTADGENQKPVVANKETNFVIKQQQQQQQLPPQQTQPQKPVVANKVVDKANLRPLPGTSSTHKESVFMKLNKRVAALEQNMSLGGEQLSLELSKRCSSIARDEFAKQQEKLTKAAEIAAKQETRRVEQDMKEKISELQREIRRLSSQLQAVATTVQTTGGGGYFYRPMLSPVVGYSASDSHCGEGACLTGGIGVTIPPLHSTSSPPSLGAMPIMVSSQFDARSSEGLWTTSQVILLVITVQICTVMALRFLRFVGDRLQRGSPTTKTIPPVAPTAQLIPLN